MAEPMVNLPEFARRAATPYPTMHKHMKDGKLPAPDVAPEENGGSALWRKATADKWIKDQGGEPVLPDKPRPMPPHYSDTTEG
jgi:predicted DNA-binding transcriptional regulator AlpA